MKRKILYIIISLLAVLLAVNIGIIIYLNNLVVRVKKQIELAQTYLADMEYEEAIDAFEEVIEIEPRNTEAWLGIVEAYIREGDYENALDYSQKGYETTDDGQFLEKQKMIESGNIKDSLGNILRQTGYDSSNNVSWWIDFTYNKDGNTDTAISYDENGNITGQVTCVYNEKGQCTIGYHNAIYIQGSSEIRKIRKSEYEYDEKGRTVKDYQYDTDDQLPNCLVYEYDSKDNKIKTIVYNSEGELEPCIDIELMQ